MAQLVSSINTTFTPAAGDFTVESAGATINVVRRIAGTTPWRLCGQVRSGESVNVSNPVGSTEYQLQPASAVETPSSVRADQ